MQVFSFTEGTGESLTEFNKRIFDLVYNQLLDGTDSYPPNPVILVKASLLGSSLVLRLTQAMDAAPMITPALLPIVSQVTSGMLRDPEKELDTALKNIIALDPEKMRRGEDDPGWTVVDIEFVTNPHGVGFVVFMVNLAIIDPEDVAGGQGDE